MVLHKQLRVLSRGTPCMIFDIHGNCAYSGVSNEILSCLNSLKNSYRDSFVKDVSLVTEPELSLKIIVKCKEV